MSDRRTMPSSAGPNAASAETRTRAERHLEDRLRRQVPGIEETDVTRLVHELSVHQIELEMQNDELRTLHAQLEESRDRYASLYEQAPVGYVTTRFDGTIVDVNRLASQMLGLRADLLRGRGFSEFFVGGDRLKYRNASERLAARLPASIELELRPKEGPPIRVLMSLALQPLPEGELQVRIAMLDETERLRLHADRARLAAIVASSSDAIVSRDLDGCIRSWNRGAEALFGISADEALGKPLDIVMPPEQQAADREMIYALCRGLPVKPFETEWRVASGERMPLLVSVSPILDLDGAVVGSSLVGRDITERKRQEQALRVRLHQLDVLAQAGHALIMTEPDAAPAQHDLFDRLRLAIGADIHLQYAVLDATTLVLVSQVGLSDRAVAAMRRQPIARSLCGLAVTRRAPLIVELLQESTLPEAAFLRGEGVRAYAGFPLLAHGESYGVAAFATTTRDRFREGDLQVAQTVCDQVAAMLDRAKLLRDLHASEESLKAVDRRKDDFIATLAHELRNPLAPIRNSVEIMGRGNLHDPQLTRCRDVIERQVMQMTRLLEDLLDVSRVTRNKIELRRERIELRPVLEDAVEANRPLMEAQRHRLQVEMPDEQIFVFGDATRLTQVVGNLLNNAGKYTDAGGEVRLSVVRDGDTVAISVRDNGIGIEPRHVGEVFDMFSQLEPALQRSRGGLGIGLALSRGLVEKHGGSIEARSEGAGTGSEFVVRLPVVHLPADADAAAAGPDVTPRASLSGLRVLVVDDNADAAETLATMLRLHGVETRLAFGGMEGLQVSEEWRPDVAVVDIGMPQFNGYELCRRMRAGTHGERMLIVACTGWGQNEDRARARAAGFDVHLVKPIDPDALIRTLRLGRAGVTPLQ